VGIDWICGSLHFADQPAVRAPKCPVLESGPARDNAHSLHVDVAHRAAGSDNFRWRKLVGELSVTHGYSPIAGGSTTLSVTDTCRGRGGDANQPTPDQRLRIPQKHARMWRYAARCGERLDAPLKTHASGTRQSFGQNMSALLTKMLILALVG
jgi:hypothetical protein